MVSIPQAVWIACNSTREAAEQAIAEVSIPQAVWIACNGNEGRWRRLHKVSIPQAVWIACNHEVADMDKLVLGFNTASGMDCMQWEQRNCSDKDLGCFNTASGMDCMQFVRFRRRRKPKQFQYRKRYGLHAILSMMTITS